MELAGMMGQRRSRIVAAKDFGKGSRHGARLPQ